MIGVTALDREQLESSVEYAHLGDDIVIVRVLGRGTFQNSPCLEKLDDEFRKRNESVRYIIDLEQCNYLDSTFMGVLAFLGSNQLKRTKDKMTVINLTQHALKLLSTLGLTQILNVRQGAPEEELDSAEFQPTTLPAHDKYKQIVHMLEAHKTLLDLDTQNELRFQKVITLLEESLKREEQRMTGNERPPNAI